MSSYPGSYAVPGAMWPGAIWLADVITSDAPAPVTANPVLFTLGRGRNGTSSGRWLTQPATSTQYVQVQVTATLDGAPCNPAADVVQMAFVPAPAAGLPPNPADGQWDTAGWETDPGPVYWASILTGAAIGGVDDPPDRQ